MTLPVSANNSIANAAIGSGFTLTNPVGSTLTANASPGEGEGLGPGMLLNEGTFVKTGGSRYYLSMPMNNNGDVQVQQNNLRLDGAGTHTGTFEVSSGAQLELAGTELFQPGATISGLGGVAMLSGTATINSNVTTGYMWLNGGTLAGTGNLQPGYFTLSAGTLAHDLTLPVSANNSIANAAIGSGFTLTNPVGSTLTANASPGEGEGLGPGMLLNEGTFVKTGGSRYYLSMPMNNNGDVQVQQNNLRLDGAGTHTGTFEVSSGAQLELAGTELFQPGATISGLGGVAMLSGTATINSNVTTGYMWLNGGTLAGTGNLQPGYFTLSAGTLARDLTLPVSANNSIANAAIGSGFTLTNPVGSTLTANASPGEGEGLGPGMLLNEGTFVKTGGSRYYLSMPMNNNGDVQVQQNNLRLDGAGTHTGTFEVSSGRAIGTGRHRTVPTRRHDFGLGGLRLLGGTSTINSDVNTGFIWLSSGTLMGSGNLNPGHFTLDGGTFARNLTLNASTSNTITSLGIASGFTLTNPNVGQLGTSNGTVTGPGNFINQGIINKTGTGTETFATFTNMPIGSVNVQAGTLALSGIGTQQGTFAVSSGATLTFGGQATGNTALTTGTLITGAGRVNVAQGTLSVPGGSSNDYAGGTTIGSGGRLNITGTGTALSPATATVQSGGVLSIGDPSNLLTGQALVQSGGALAVRSDFIPQSQIASTSSGTFAIDLTGFATPVDLSVLGNGAMSMGSSLIGSYVASTLGVGTGNTYRLGGGGGTLTLTQADVLTGDHSLVIVGPGTVVLPQSQDFTLGTTVQSGTVAIGSTGSLGSGPVTVQGGAIQGTGSPITLFNDMTFAGNFAVSGASDLTLAGTEKLTGNRTVTVTNTGTTTISGNVTQDVAGRSLTIKGTGSVVLSGNNSFTGGLSIQGGTVTLAAEQHFGGTTIVDLGSSLVLNADLLGGGNVTVCGGATLSGEGIVAGATTVANNSFLSPGHSPGALTFNNGLALQSGSHYTWELGALSRQQPRFRLGSTQFDWWSTEHSFGCVTRSEIHRHSRCPKQWRHFLA